MKIAIIGAGNVGGTLGKRWAAKGHQIFFGTREPQSPKIRTLLQSMGSNAKAVNVNEAAPSAEVVVVATSWPAAEDALRMAGNLNGKVLVDCTNPLSSDLSGLLLGHTTSAAEQIAKWAPGARVVKAFNTTGAGNMLNPQFGSEKASMFICGSDTTAKTTVAHLAEELGFDVVDAGPLVNARLLEPLAMLWINLAYQQRMGTNIAIKLLRR